MKLISVLLSYSRRTVILAVFGGIITGGCNAAMLAIIHGALTAGRASFPKSVVGLHCTLDYSAD